jgi:putative serine protease PepD
VSVSPWAQPSYYGEPWAQQQGQAAQPGNSAPQPGNPLPGNPLPGNPQGGNPAAPGYPGQPGNVYAGQPGNVGPQAGAAHPANAGPGYPMQAYPVPPEGWTPGATAPPGPARPNRAGKYVAIAAGAVVLALASGTIGAVAVLGLDDSGVLPTTSQTHVADPVIDRSSLSDIAQRVQPSVVSVKTETGEGSGVVLTADGYVLTNNHVVASARGNTVTLAFSNGKTAKATIVGTDPRTDLAVVKAQGVSGLTPAAFGDSGAMRVGDTVLALGSPLGLDGSVTAGIVSAVDRTIQVGGEQDESSPLQRSSGVTSISGVIQTDAAINPGNSGGALVNLEGQVIGINTAILTAGGGNGNIGVGFAIPGNRAKAVSEQLRSGGKVSHSYLGVAVTPAEQGGAQVTTVQAGSPAEAAGLQQGDIITKAGESAVNDSDDLISAVQSRKVGDRLEITYIRGGAEKKTTVTLAEASN